jgi:glycyl-tRNA synthetase beta chain
MRATLVVELLTEELPPKSLAPLARAFTEAIYDGLVLNRLLEQSTYDPQRIFATPRRLAVLVPEVLDAASDRESEVAGPSVKAPAEAVAGFAKKHGMDARTLEQRETPKGKVFVARVRLKGATLETALSTIVSEAIKKLPIPKVMRWGDGNAQFVRPVHGLLFLHGTRRVPGSVLGVPRNA